MRAPRCCVWILFVFNFFPAVRKVNFCICKRPGIADNNVGLFLQHFFYHIYCRRFPRVTGIGLKGEPEDDNSFFRYGVEHSLDHCPYKTGHLVIVNPNDIFPVMRHFRKAVMFAQVHEVENVFFKARSAEPYACAQEFVAYAAVFSNSKRDL